MKKYNGVPYLGTQKQILGLYKADELVSTPSAVSLAPTNPDLWKTYPLRNQNRKNSCTYNARAKMAGILQEQINGEFIVYSDTDYRKRSNKGSGSSPIEALDFMRKDGIGLEALEESDKMMTDAEVDKFKQTEFEKQVAKASTLDAYYGLNMYDFDQFVSTLHATKKPIMVGFFSTLSEWNQEVVEIKDKNLTPDNAYVRHEVCATPNYGIYKGKEGFTIEDSWGSAGINKKGVRWITREFFEKRNYILGLVPTRFKTYEDLGIVPAKPVYNFQNNLEYGSQGADVVALQDILKYEGFFPANHSSTGNYYELTAKAVLEWQLKHKVDSDATLNTLGGRYFGTKSRIVSNKLYK
jgi:hypothetical protein